MRENQAMYTDGCDNQHYHIPMGFMNGNSANDLGVMEMETNLRPKQIIIQTLLHQLQYVASCPPIHRK